MGIPTVCIKVETKEESKLVQEHLFKHGFAWGGSGRTTYFDINIPNWITLGEYGGKNITYSAGNVREHMPWERAFSLLEIPNPKEPVCVNPLLLLLNR